jgi:hypothetical protein
MMDLREQIVIEVHHAKPVHDRCAGDDRIGDAVWSNVVEPALAAKDAEIAHLKAQLAEITAVRPSGYCHGQHVTMTAFAEKISAKLNAEGQRAEAVEYARAREAEVRRVRALCQSDDAEHPEHDHLCPDDVLAAIDQPKET